MRYYRILMRNKAVGVDWWPYNNFRYDEEDVVYWLQQARKEHSNVEFRKVEVMPDQVVA